MRNTSSHLQNVERAERWAQHLEGVERNTFLSLVADFLSDPTSEVARLRRALELLGRGNGGHLERSGSFGVQARIVCQELPPLLSEGDLPGSELRATLGWTARLLLIRRPSRRDASGGQPKPGKEKRDSPSPWRGAPTKPPYRRPERPSAPPPVLPVAPGPQSPNWRPQLQGLGWGNAEKVVVPLLASLQGEERRKAAQEILTRLGKREVRRRASTESWVEVLLAAAQGE